MYRKPSGELGFSLTRFMNNAAPNLAADPNREADLPSRGRDMLYGHQLASTGAHAPYALDDQSFFAGGVCGNEGQSRLVMEKLRKAGLVTAEGLVDTRALDGARFAHQLAVLPSRRQKDLVNLLFWWEEECVRLRRLVEDERELGVRIEGAKAQMGLEIEGEEELRVVLDGLRFEREKIRMRIKQLPSQRREDVERGTDSLFAASCAADSDIAPDERPPEYRP